MSHLGSQSGRSPHSSRPPSLLRRALKELIFGGERRTGSGGEDDQVVDTESTETNPTPHNGEKSNVTELGAPALSALEAPGFEAKYHDERRGGTSSSIRVESSAVASEDYEHYHPGVAPGPEDGGNTIARELSSEASEMAKDELQIAKAEIAGLGVKLEKSDERVAILKERLATANAALKSAKEQRLALVERNKATVEKMNAARTVAAERRDKLVDSLSRTRESLVQKAALWNAAKRYFALFRQGLLYDEIEKSDADLSADTYLCLLPSTVPAAMALSRKYGGRVVCDCVENVEVNRQSLAPNLHPPALEMVNFGAYGALTAVDGIMTVSNAVASTLKRFGPPVRVQPNYRRYEVPDGSTSIRDYLQLDDEATVLVTTGNVINGFERVIDAVSMLPEHIHLAAFVKVSPPSYAKSILEYIENAGVSHRIHLNGFVPYQELAGLLADADAGLITLDPENPNHSVSLPNRVFDFTTAALPFVVPPIPEIAAYVEKHGCGVVLEGVSADAWVEGIKTVLSGLPTFRENIVEARRNVTWESMDDDLFSFLGSPGTVTMLGFRDLSRYQRFLRVADSLTSKGTRVKAAFFSENPMPVKNKDVEFYHFANRYGIGPALSKVPYESVGPDAS